MPVELLDRVYLGAAALCGVTALALMDPVVTSVALTVALAFLFRIKPVVAVISMLLSLVRLMDTHDALTNTAVKYFADTAAALRLTLFSALPQQMCWEVARAFATGASWPGLRAATPAAMALAAGVAVETDVLSKAMEAVASLMEFLIRVVTKVVAWFVRLMAFAAAVK